MIGPEHAAASVPTPQAGGSSSRSSDSGEWSRRLRVEVKSKNDLTLLGQSLKIRPEPTSGNQEYYD